MGFSLNPFKNPLEKGIRKLAGKSPVLNKLPGVKSGPGKVRTGTATKSPIAPSPGVVNAGVAGNAAPRPAPADMSKMGATGGPPPMQMQPPQMTAPPPMEAPEAVPGMADMAQMQGPPQMPPQMPPPMMPPQQAPSGIPQMGNLQEMLKQRMGGNTGIAGGIKARYPSGIGPRFMGQ